MQTVAGERLEETLGFWKDCAFMTEVLAHCVCEGEWSHAVQEHMRRWRSFDHLVLNNAVKELPIKDWLMPQALAENAPTHVLAMQCFPIEFFEWSRKSRRIYQLNAGLQHMFANSTYEDVRWADVKWPFDAFIIELEEPMRVEDDAGVWSEYDSILVAQLPNPDGLYIHVRIFRKPNAYAAKRFPIKTRLEIEKMLGRGNFDRARRLLNQGLLQSGKPPISLQGVHMYPLFDARIHSPESRVRIEADDIWEEARAYNASSRDEAKWRLENMSLMLKIVIGFSFYVRTLSSIPVERQVIRKRRPGTKGVTGIITNPEYLCEVIGRATLDPSEYGIRRLNKESSDLFVRPHWRRGHDRRPAGSPLDAEKTVWVPRMFIRADLMPDYGVISGTHTKILPED